VRKACYTCLHESAHKSVPVLRIHVAFALASALPLGAQLLPAAEHAVASWLSTAGSFSIVPIDTWGSGDFDALADSLFGYDTPRLNQLSLDMEQTACTTYEGELFLKKLRLKVGLNIDVDNNLIGRLDRFMGYINYDGFTLRVQTPTCARLPSGAALISPACLPYTRSTIPLSASTSCTTSKPAA